MRFGGRTTWGTWNMNGNINTCVAMLCYAIIFVLAEREHIQTCKYDHWSENPKSANSLTKKVASLIFRWPGLRWPQMIQYFPS